MSVNTSFQMRDKEVSDRYVVYVEEKRVIARYEISLIRKDDFVYIDAGTTAEFLLDHITEAMEMLFRYNFTIGFWGTDGIHRKTGYTTPDREEAGVKHALFCNCKKGYIVADSSKFDFISPVRFAKFEDVVIITEKIAEGYGGFENIIIVE